MRKTGAILVLTMALFCAATSGFAKPAKSEGTEGAFAKLKQLQGNWIGTHKTEKGDERFPVSYTLSSGDSILVEKISKDIFFKGASNLLLKLKFLPTKTNFSGLRTS